MQAPANIPVGGHWSMAERLHALRENLTIKLIGPTNGITPPIAGNSYGLRCYYYYDIHSDANFSLFTNVDELVGSGWIKTGFGNKEFKCVTDPNNPDVTACAGSRGN